MQEIFKISENAELADKAALWFHEKWKIPLEKYQESMAESSKPGNIVPEWYIMIQDNKIIGGMGVIENDFHNRKDLTPNVCAVYVEKDFRNKGIAGKLLSYVCNDMKSQGIDTLYLLTDHDSFYERYDWQFFCLAQGDGEQEMSRMYVHKS
ncbi:MAG: GNAT family N-acetyltransferase [Candidatus Riflebacteria bacterium]|nr:GNAT family N-acetyltransferase [Candidatus Riflebacteria bacterium]